MSTSRPFTFDRVVRILATLAIIAVAVWLINLLKNVLLPFCVACLIAYLLEPLVELHQRFLHLKGRAIAVILTLLEATCVIGALGYFFIPSAINEIEQLDNLVTNSRDVTSPLLPVEVQEYLKNLVSSKNINSMLSGSRLETLLDKSSSLLTTVIDFLLHTLEWLLTFIYVIFILLDYNRLMRGFKLLVPPKFRKTAYRVGNDIKDSMNRYFRGQALIAMCAAIFYCIGFSIVKLPMAIILGIIVGILYLIPYFQYVTLIPVVVLCFIYSLTGEVGFWEELGKCIMVYVVSQCICDYVLTPKIMGKAMGLNPAIILLSLSVWGTLLGIIGMIIALPMTTLLLAYYEEYVIGTGETDTRQKPAHGNPTP